MCYIILILLYLHKIVKVCFLLIVSIYFVKIKKLLSFKDWMTFLVDKKINQILFSD